MARLLTPEEVAELLGTNVRAVLDLARAYVNGNPKGIPGVKVLREWRFTLQDVEGFVAANRTTPKVAGVSVLPALPAELPPERTVSRRRVKR